MKKKVFIKDVEDLSEDVSKIIKKAAELAAKYSNNSKLLNVFTDTTQSLTWKKEELDNAAKAAKNYDKKKIEEAKMVNKLYREEICDVGCDDRYDFDFEDDDDEEDEEDKD